MSCANRQDFCAPKGSTFQATIRWATNVVMSVPVSGITQAAPAVVNAVGHGLPANWPACVVGVTGMSQINAQHFPPRSADMVPVTVVDANHVALSTIDSSLFSAYVSGGFLVAYQPGDLSSIASAALTIYDVPTMDDTPLLTLSSGSGLALNNATKTITATFATAGLSWSTGYYNLMLTDNTGAVIPLAEGVITIEV